MTNGATVFVVDDDEDVRKSLCWLIESVGLRVKLFESAARFLDEYDPDVPGCLILDVRMPEMSGLELQEVMAERNISIPVIFVTAHGDVPIAVRAMKSGAVHVFEKPFAHQDLIDHVQKAIGLDEKNRERDTQRKAVARRIDTLTDREREVMELVVEGHSSKDIAHQLGVSFKTVEAHRSKIMKKMDAQGVPHLIHLTLASKIPNA